MYYLRKEPYETTILEIKKTDGTIILEKKYMPEDRAVYKHNKFSRFYRKKFNGIDEKYQGMKLYKCKSLKRILELQEDTFNYCGELFDVYNENGKVEYSICPKCGKKTLFYNSKTEGYECENCKYEITLHDIENVLDEAYEEHLKKQH